MAGQVQRQNGVALWRQIADRIRASIAAGAYDQTGMVPPETVLAAQFGVNRHTVRSALAALAQEGIVRAVQGRGTMIERRDRLNFPIGLRTRFTSGVADQVRHTRGLLLSDKQEAASADIASKLGLQPGAKILRLETLRIADEQPISSAVSWFPADRFPGLAEIYRETQSVTASFAALGLSDYIRAKTEISAEHADAADMKSLELAAGAIVLVTRALNTDLERIPVQFSITRFAADRVQFSVEN